MTIKNLTVAVVAVLFALGTVASANPSSAPNVGLNAGVVGIAHGTTSQFKTPTPNVGLNAGVAGIR